MAAAAGLLLAGLVQGPVALAALETSLSPRRVELGELLTVQGRGCAPGDLVRLRLAAGGQTSEDSAIADEAGAFSHSMRVLAEMRPGRAAMRSECRDEAGRRITDRAVVLLVRPPRVVHLVNVLFGVGAFFVVLGVGWDVRTRSRRRRRRRPR